MFMVLLSVVLAFPVLSSEVAFLDLTKIIIRNRIREPNTATASSGGVGVGGIPHREPKEPLRLTLLSLDKNKAELGDDIIYELKVENVGNEPFIIPWNPHSADLEPEDAEQPYEYTSGWFSLGGKDESGDLVFLGGVNLYSSSNAPETSIELRPGDWVRLRAKVQLMTTSEGWRKKLQSSSKLSLRLRVHFSISQNTVTPKNGGYHLASRSDGKLIKSSNAVPFVLRPYSPNTQF